MVPNTTMTKFLKTTHQSIRLNLLWLLRLLLLCLLADLDWRVNLSGVLGTHGLSKQIRSLSLLRRSEAQSLMRKDLSNLKCWWKSKVSITCVLTEERRCDVISTVAGRGELLTSICSFEGVAEEIKWIFLTVSEKTTEKHGFVVFIHCLHVQVLSEMAVCEDLWELLEEVEGERLSLKRSSTFFRLLFNCVSEPEIYRK